MQIKVPEVKLTEFKVNEEGRASTQSLVLLENIVLNSVTAERFCIWVGNAERDQEQKNLRLKVYGFI